MTKKLLNTYNEIKDYSSRFKLPEYKAVPYGKRVYNDKFPKYITPTKLIFSSDPSENEEACTLFNLPCENTFTFNLKVDGFSFPIKVTASKNKYGNLSFSTFPVVGSSLKRKSKSCPNGIRLTKEMLKNSSDYQSFVQTMKKKSEIIDKLATANFLIKLRESGYIDKENLKDILLEEKYNKIQTKQEQKEFLINNGFTGVEENFDFEMTSHPDGHGHETGRAMMLDFKNKSCYITGWSSD